MDARLRMRTQPPEGLGIDANNNLYIADVLDYVIREVSSATGKISIFAEAPLAAVASIRQAPGRI